MIVRLKAGKHYKNGVRYVAGDVFDASEAEMASFGDRLEVVGEAMPVPVQTPVSVDAFPGISDEVADILRGAGYSDLNHLLVSDAVENLEGIAGLSKKQAGQIRKLIAQLNRGA